MRCFLVVAALLVSFGTPELLRAEEGKLAFAPSKGTVLGAVQKFRWAVEVPGRGKMTWKGETHLSYEVLEVGEEGKVKMQAVYGLVKLDFDLGPLGAVQYDSEKKEDETKLTNTFVAPYALTGEKFTFTLSPAGEVVGDVEGLEKIKKKVSKRLENAPPMMGPNQNPEKRFTQTAFKKSLEEIFKIPAPEPAKVKEGWTEPDCDFEAPMGMPLKLTGRKYKVFEDGAEKTVFKVEAKFAVSSGGGGGMGQMAQFLKFQKNTFKGEFVFDRKEKTVRKNAVESRFELVIPEEMKGMLPPNMADLKISSEGSTSWEVLEVKKPG
jgi:hypothetical protein